MYISDSAGVDPPSVMPQTLFPTPEASALMSNSSASLLAAAASSASGHPGPVRSPYSSSGSSYLPPPTSAAATHHSLARSMANVRSNGKFCTAPPAQDFH